MIAKYLDADASSHQSGKMTQETEILSDEAIAALSFEDALARLENIVRQLESGEASLDNSINLYTYGEKLRTACQKRLDDAKSRIEKITQKSDGSIGTSAFDS